MFRIMPLWLWQGHVLLVVMRKDAEGNKYCHYEVTANFCCSSERGVMFSFAGEAI
jgi:hypothetical protein